MIILKKIPPHFVTAVVVGLGSLATTASAAIDTATITTALTDAGVACGVVGAAYLVVVVSIKGFKLIRAAL